MKTYPCTYECRRISLNSQIHALENIKTDLCYELRLDDWIFYAFPSSRILKQHELADKFNSNVLNVFNQEIANNKPSFLISPDAFWFQQKIVCIFTQNVRKLLKDKLKLNTLPDYWVFNNIRIMSGVHFRTTDSTTYSLYRVDTQWNIESIAFSDSSYIRKATKADYVNGDWFRKWPPTFSWYAFPYKKNLPK